MVSFITSLLWMGPCLTSSVAIGVTEAGSLFFFKIQPMKLRNFRMCVLSRPSLEKKISVEIMAFVSDVTVLCWMISQVSLRSISNTKQCFFFVSVEELHAQLLVNI